MTSDARSLAGEVMRELAVGQALVEVDGHDRPVFISGEGVLPVGLAVEVELDDAGVVQAWRRRVQDK